MGIDTPLVDVDGFPRNDVDVYRARHLRRRFKEIQTDVAAIEGELECGLAGLAGGGGGGSGGSGSGTAGGIANPTAVGGGTAGETTDDETAKRRAPKPPPKFDARSGRWVVRNWDGSLSGAEGGEGRSFDDLARGSTGELATAIIARSPGENGGEGASAAAAGSGATSTASARRRARVQYDGPTTPFAVIDEVSPLSPASDAGLLVDDAVLRFGTVDHTTPEGFRAVATLVPAAAERRGAIEVVVRRKGRELGGVVEVVTTEVLELRPRGWEGRGLLGCHVRPI